MLPLRETLSFDRPVDRTLVHRESVSDVLPTDLQRNGQDQFAVAMQWPRCHGFFRANRLDSLLLAEAIRQGSILVCHVGYEVPASMRFLMTRIGFEIRGPGTGLARPGRAREIVATVRATDLSPSPRGSLRSPRFDFEFYDETGLVAIGYGEGLLVEERTYLRMRGSHHRATAAQRRIRPNVNQEAVGRRETEDVVVSSHGDGLVVDVDGSHPYFFDHLLDHVPGVALIEAFRQAVSLRTNDPDADLLAFEGEFTKMVEFDTAASIDLDSDAAGFRCRVWQAGSLALEASAAVVSPALAAAT